MNRSEVALLLATVQSGDRRTVGEADVELWHAVIGDDVQLGFAQQAVVAHFRDMPGVWLEPGHILQRWKDFRRDQFERSDEMREARQAALDARLVEAVEELGEAFTPPKFQRREGPNPLNVACPWCKASIGRACTIPNTHTITKPHPSRIEKLEEIA
jgi:hypothetical protein